MAVFCIPRHLAQKLKESALKGEVDIKALYKMSSVDRRAFFTKYTDEELGKFINTQFEKAMVSKQRTALTDWATSVFSPKQQMQPVYKNIVDKINSLEESGILTPQAEKAFLQDLVSDKIGLNVSPKEIEQISIRAKEIDVAQKALGEDLGNPLELQKNLDFFKAKKAMDDYLQGLAPASKLKVLTGTIGRGMMLFSVKSPVLNIGSNIEVGFTEALSRRVSALGVRGADYGLAKDFVKMANKIYQSTGYDISRMTSLRDTGASGARVLDETVHAQGPGAIRSVGRVMEDIVFKQLMGAPDVIFASGHFADSVNLNSLKIAKGNRELARKHMIDAMKLEPKTAEGEILRAQAILDAEKATWTDSSWASKLSLGVRKIFNDVSGDYRVGDYLFPFVKTPSNVIATGIDYAGLGIPKAMIDTVKAYRSGNLRSREYTSSLIRNVTRSGMGLTLAAILAYNTDPENFVGAYDPQRAQLEELRGSNTNSFKVGSKWISVDWLGPISVSYSAMMYAKKYGGAGGEKTFQYSSGVIGQVKRLPGIEDAFDYIKTQTYKKNQSLEEMTGEAQAFLIQEASSRLMPSFVSDIAKAIDPYDREAVTSWEAFKKKIPFLRETLPEKKNILGESILTEPAWSTILFGARVRTSTADAVTEELYNLSEDTGKNINFTNWQKTSGKKLGQMKMKLGAEKYAELQQQYSEILRNKLAALIENPEYQALSAEDKIDGVNSLDSKIIQKIMDDVGFKYNPDWKPTKTQYIDSRSSLGLVSDYVKAFQADPSNAWKALTTKETLGIVEGNLVELQRFYGIEWDDKGGSQEYKENLMEQQGIPLSDLGNWKLEHIVPVSAGGGTDKDNLYLATNEMHDFYTPIDIALGKAVKEEKITRKEAEKLAIDFKINQTITAEDLLAKLNF